MSFSFVDIIGIIGVGLVVIAYFYVQSGKWRSDDIIFPITNLLGALAILVSLYENPNIPSIIIEFIWIGISLYGIWRIKTTEKK